MALDASPDNADRMSAENEKKNPDIYPMHAAVMREMAEPTDGFEPAPVWLLLLYFAIAGSAGWYLALYSGAFRPEIYNELPAAVYGGLTTQKLAPVDPMVLGKRVFNNCTQCHQATGQGLRGMYPPLAGSEWVNGPPEILARILLYGLNGNVTVRGATYNGEMPTTANGQLKILAIQSDDYELCGTFAPHEKPLALPLFQNWPPENIPLSPAKRARGPSSGPKWTRAPNATLDGYILRA